MDEWRNISSLGFEKHRTAQLFVSDGRREGVVDEGGGEAVGGGRSAAEAARRVPVGGGEGKGGDVRDGLEGLEKRREETEVLGT